MAKSDQGLQVWNDGADNGIGKVQPADMERYIQSGAQFERAIKLTEGEKVEGIYLGEGTPREFEDKATGELREVKTFRFEIAKGQVATITGSVQLDREIPSKLVVGKRGVVVRAAQRDISGGRRMTDYYVANLEP